MSRARDGIERADPLVVSDVRAVGLRLLSPVPHEDGSLLELHGRRAFTAKFPDPAQDPFQP